MMHPCIKEEQEHPGCHQGECCQPVEGGGPSPLFSTGEATSGVLCPMLGSPVRERYGHTGVSPVNSHKDD